MCRKFRYQAIHQTLIFPLSLPCPAISLSSHLIFSHNKFNPWHKWLFCFSIWPLVPATAVLVPEKMQCSGASSVYLTHQQRVLLHDSQLKLCWRKEGQREVCPEQSQRKSAESSWKPANLHFSLIPSGLIQRPLNFGFGPICRRLCPNPV